MDLGGGSLFHALAHDVGLGSGSFRSPAQCLIPPVLAAGFGRELEIMGPLWLSLGPGCPHEPSLVGLLACLSFVSGLSAKTESSSLVRACHSLRGSVFCLHNAVDGSQSHGLREMGFYPRQCAVCIHPRQLPSQQRPRVVRQASNAEQMGILQVRANG